MSQPYRTVFSKVKHPLFGHRHHVRDLGEDQGITLLEIKSGFSPRTPFPHQALDTLL